MREREIKFELIGQKFGKLEVIEFSHWRFRESKGKKGRLPIWKCKCECGNIKDIVEYNLERTTRSCGCSRQEGYIKALLERPDNNQAAKVLYSSYKAGAKIRNLDFNINLEQFLELTSQNCYLCGTQPSTIQKTTHKYVKVNNYIYNGVDRIDNNIGYEISNCRTCCNACNTMKMDRDIRHFIQHIRNIIQNVDSDKELLNLVSEDKIEYKRKVIC